MNGQTWQECKEALMSADRLAGEWRERCERAEKDRDRVGDKLRNCEGKSAIIQID